MSVYAARSAAPEGQREELDAAAAQARRLGVEYLKLSRDQNLDEWLEGANRKMQPERMDR